MFLFNPGLWHTPSWHGSMPSPGHFPAFLPPSALHTAKPSDVHHAVFLDELKANFLPIRNFLFSKQCIYREEGMHTKQQAIWGITGHRMRCHIIGMYYFWQVFWPSAFLFRGKVHRRLCIPQFKCSHWAFPWGLWRWCMFSWHHGFYTAPELKIPHTSWTTLWEGS